MDLVEQLSRHGRQLMVSAVSAGLDAPVPSCPRWDVRRLVNHVTKVHHWALHIYGGGAPDDFTFAQPDDAELFSVYAAGLKSLATGLAVRPRTDQIWTYVPGASGAEFWPRRMAHETAMHRVDAELAAGLGVNDFDPEFAADGLDELLVAIAPARFNTSRVDRPFRVTFTPLDSNRAWTISVAPGSVSTEPVARDGSDLTVFADASLLYRWAWNRVPDDEVSLVGEVTVADRWRQHLTVGSRTDAE
ncbi:MAG: hypothetical protein JWN95_3232 [Frankiales bacterium]|nr:hypothetical protein [Frankiales bacterium]